MGFGAVHCIMRPSGEPAPLLLLLLLLRELMRVYMFWNYSWAMPASAVHDRLCVNSATQGAAVDVLLRYTHSSSLACTPASTV
jgi:hypothetical protein